MASIFETIRDISQVLRSLLRFAPIPQKSLLHFSKSKHGPKYTILYFEQLERRLLRILRPVSEDYRTHMVRQAKVVSMRTERVALPNQNHAGGAGFRL